MGFRSNPIRTERVRDIRTVRFGKYLRKKKYACKVLWNEAVIAEESRMWNDRKIETRNTIKSYGTSD